MPREGREREGRNETPDIAGPARCWRSHPRSHRSPAAGNGGTLSPLSVGAGGLPSGDPMATEEFLVVADLDGSAQVRASSCRAHRARRH